MAGQTLYTARPILGLTGAAGCGKSTAAIQLAAAHGFTRTRFAEPLKAMLRGLGLTVDQVDGDQKEAPAELLGGKSPRFAMQTLGTEWGRVLIDPDLWVNAWAQSIAGAHGPLVVDDVRFPNEVAMIRRLGGRVVRILRPGLAALGDHVSEAGAALLPVDAEVLNDGSAEQLARRLVRISGAVQ